MIAIQGIGCALIVAGTTILNDPATGVPIAFSDVPTAVRWIGAIDVSVGA